jgi:transposase
MIGALRLEGANARATIRGATDTEVFQAYIRDGLCPTLRPGDVVIMDNLSPHKNEPTLALIAQAGAEVRFLPAYSPDLNPIEKMWSKVKTSLRTAEARTEPDLQQAIGAALASVTRQDAMGWFASCGYSFILIALVAGLFPFDSYTTNPERRLPLADESHGPLGHSPRDDYQRGGLPRGRGG